MRYCNILKHELNTEANGDIIIRTDDEFIRIFRI